MDWCKSGVCSISAINDLSMTAAPGLPPLPTKQGGCVAFESFALVSSPPSQPGCESQHVSLRVLRRIR